MKEKQNKKNRKEVCWELNKKMKYKLVFHDHLDLVVH